MQNNNNQYHCPEQKQIEKALEENTIKITFPNLIPIELRELIPLEPIFYDIDINEDIGDVGTKLKQYCFESNLLNKKAKLDEEKDNKNSLENTNKNQQPSSKVKGATANTDEDQQPSNEVKGATCSTFDKYFSQLFSCFGFNI